MKKNSNRETKIYLIAKYINQRGEEKKIKEDRCRGDDVRVMMDQVGRHFWKSKNYLLFCIQNFFYDLSKVHYFLIY